MNYFSKAVLFSTAMIFASACSNAQSKPQQHAKPSPTMKTSAKTSHTGYSKPSAAIDFRHNFSGRAALGVTETVSLKVLDNYPGGQMTLQHYPSAGIQLFQNNGLQSTTAQLSGDSPNNFDLQFQAKSEGVHSITTVATVTMANGQVITRSYSMPIYVGEKFQPTKQDYRQRQQVKTGNVSGGMVIMDAEETIEVSD